MGRVQCSHRAVRSRGSSNCCFPRGATVGSRCLCAIERHLDPTTTMHPSHPTRVANATTCALRELTTESTAFHRAYVRLSQQGAEEYLDACFLPPPPLCTGGV